MKVSIDFLLGLRVFGLKVQNFVDSFFELGPCYWPLIEIETQI
jgi:hypothetical protein